MQKKTDNREAPPVIDMSPEAIDRRLRTVGELYRFGMALRSARRLGKVHPLRPAT